MLAWVCRRRDSWRRVGARRRCARAVTPGARAAFLASHVVPFLDTEASVRVTTFVKGPVDRCGRLLARERRFGVTYWTLVRPASPPPAGPAGAVFDRVLTQNRSRPRRAACLARRRHEQVVALMERCCDNPATVAFPLRRRHPDVLVDRVVGFVVDLVVRMLRAARRWCRRRLIVLENALGRRLGCSLHAGAPKHGWRRQPPTSATEGARRGGHR